MTQQKQNKAQPKRRGVTLVEIAIVLVIIGLLLGGVLKGQELINNAKVRAMADRQRRSAFLFNRSLRLDDNLGLLKAVENSSSVLPVFCVDPRQASPANNKYFSPFALNFMLESLKDLQSQLQANGSDLLVIEGQPHIVLPSILQELSISTLYMNKDYSPFARSRFSEIQSSLALSDVTVVEVDDYLLYPIGSLATGSGTAYRVFTPFYNASKRQVIDKPQPFSNGDRLMKDEQFKLYMQNKGWDLLDKHSKATPEQLRGGRSPGLEIIAKLPESQRYYEECRDFLSYNTSQLSAYIKFGCVSAREVWEGMGKIRGPSTAALRRQLIWREFYYHYYAAYPEELEWGRSSEEAELGEAAPDIVKACYQQLDTTGCLHNRGRMILANYILHNQGDYWKTGDLLFSRRLVDYDPMVNVGNWRWIEKQPKFRWLKPDTQYQRWDKDHPHSDEKKGRGHYTKHWLSANKKLKQSQLKF